MHRPSRLFEVVLAERLAHVPAAAWTALTQSASVFMQAPFLSAFEAALPEGVTPRYALLFDGPRAVAAVVMQVVRVRGATTVSPQSPLRGVVQFVDERAVVLGNLAGWGGTGVAMAAEVDGAAVWNEVLLLVDRVRRFEKAEGTIHVAAVKDATHDMEPLEPVLRRHGYQLAPSGADMTLPLASNWRSFDDYLAGLTSNARRSVKKTLNAVKDAGVTLRSLSADEAERASQRLDALYLQVWSNADVHPLRLSGGFFAELKRSLGDDCALVALERDGVLVGFTVCLRSGGAAVGYYLGFERTESSPVYLRLLLAVIEQAIAWKCTSVSMGRTSEEPKARLGAVSGPSSLWVKHRAAPMNWAMGVLLGAMADAPVPEHRVFREDGGVAAAP